MPATLPLELLAPAGGAEQLQSALRFGADAVYLSGQRWGMRARANNFDADELVWAFEYAHARGAKVHVTINTLMYDSDLDELPAYLHFLDEAEADALIISDLGALALAREHAPHTALHISTQNSVTNATAAAEYVRLGATRLVLAREMTLAQVAELHRRLGDEVELEVFAHGAMCMAVSGRCLLSSALAGPERSASCGNCTQPCRWTWSIVEETRPNLPLPIEADEHGSYLLSANDLCMIEHLEELADAGVDTIKIEGRNKGAYYTAAVTNAYRHVIDGGDPNAWIGELEATSHRPFSTGFFFGNPTQNPGKAEYTRDRQLVAVGASCKPTAEGGYMAEVICRNKATVGDELTLLSPGHEVRHFTLGPIEHYDEQEELWVACEKMTVNMQRYRFACPYDLGEGDMLCL